MHGEVGSFSGVVFQPPSTHIVKAFPQLDARIPHNLKYNVRHSVSHQFWTGFWTNNGDQSSVKVFENILGEGSGCNNANVL